MKKLFIFAFLALAASWHGANAQSSTNTGYSFDVSGLAIDDGYNHDPRLPDNDPDPGHGSVNESHEGYFVIGSTVGTPNIACGVNSRVREGGSADLGGRQFRTQYRWTGGQSAYLDYAYTMGMTMNSHLGGSGSLTLNLSPSPNLANGSSSLNLPCWPGQSFMASWTPEVPVAGSVVTATASGTVNGSAYAGYESDFVPQGSELTAQGTVSMQLVSAPRSTYNSGGDLQSIIYTPWP